MCVSRRSHFTRVPGLCIAHPAKSQNQNSDRERYSGFESAAERDLEAKWRLSQENATSHDPQMATFESKPL
jgi:hypothetical protein